MLTFTTVKTESESLSAGFRCGWFTFIGSGTVLECSLAGVTGS